MKEIEKTKDNIKVDQLEDSQRKKLYQKFVDAGGQVQNERQIQRRVMIDRDKQRMHQKKLNEHYSYEKKTLDKAKASSSVLNSKSRSLQKKVEHVPFENFRISMKLRFHGITGLNTLFYKKKFLSSLSFKYKPAMMQIQNIYFSLFKQNPGLGKKIIMRLDKISPIYYELIEKAGELFDPIELRDLSDTFTSFPDVPIQLTQLEKPLTSLFRSLYIIKPYENTITGSFEKAIDLYQYLDEEKKAPFIKKKDLRNSLYVLFYILYPKLHTLYCRFNTTLFNEIDSRIEDCLAILPSEKPGNRVRYDLSQNKQADSVQEIIDDKQNEKPKKANIDPSTYEGLRNMYRLDFSILRKIYDKKGEFNILSDNDKILLTYLLYLEFESEYSFILTTNRIKYKTDYAGRGFVDYKIHMQELFNTMRKVQQAFIEYHESFLNYNKVREQKPISNDQYITYSKRVDDLARKKDIAGNNSRAMIKSFMEKTTRELDTLCKDMDDRQMYVANPQDVIEISPEIEGVKKLHGFKVFEAIRTVRDYAAAFAYRLGPDGDLCGKEEYNKQEIDSEDLMNNKEESNTEKKSNSILDELDDII